MPDPIILELLTVSSDLYSFPAPYCPAISRMVGKCSINKEYIFMFFCFVKNHAVKIEKNTFTEQLLDLSLSVVIAIHCS